MNSSAAELLHTATAAAHRVSLDAHERASLVLRHRNPPAASRHAAAARAVRSQLEPVAAGA